MTYPEADEDPVLTSVLNHTTLVYIKADARHEARLIEDAKVPPKPLYYRPEFLDDAVCAYLDEPRLSSSDEIDPDAFVRWVFPRLLEARRPRYERIARHGYVITAAEAAIVRGEYDLVRLIGHAIDRRAAGAGTEIDGVLQSEGLDATYE